MSTFSFMDLVRIDNCVSNVLSTQTERTSGTQKVLWPLSLVCTGQANTDVCNDYHNRLAKWLEMMFAVREVRIDLLHLLKKEVL